MNTCPECDWPDPVRVGDPCPQCGEVQGEYPKEARAREAEQIRQSTERVAWAIHESIVERFKEKQRP